MQFVKPFVEGLLQLLLLIPLFLLAAHAFDRDNIKYFIAFCLLFLLDNIIVQALSFPLFEEQTWN
ncbi:MAG TPA: hypothetical protein VEZ17_06055, partial [Chitinophagaceae bacterium]|nr:hypothetical protein [Chitinophagaceae bacterium]